MTRVGLACLCFATATLLPYSASAVASAEVYTSAAYGYGRLEARMRFAPGEGVVGSFFLWKVGSEAPNAFWAELDFEKLNGDCHFETNAIYGNPESNHNQQHPPDSCATYRTYTYEWTPDYVAWLVDGMEIRRDTGATPTAFAQNAASGMQFRFNVWPGDASFGGNFNPNILPVHQYIDWVQFSSYEGGTFTLDWREDFNGSTLPAGWLTANWGSPKNLSTHRPGNVNLIDGYLVLSLTADNAVGPAGAMPAAPDGSGGQGGSAGAAGTGGSAGSAGSAGVAGSSASSGSAGSAGSAGNAGAGGSSDSGGAAGSVGSAGSSGAVNSSGAGGATDGAGAGGLSGSAGAGAVIAGAAGAMASVGGSMSAAGHGGAAGSLGQGGIAGSSSQAGSAGGTGGSSLPEGGGRRPEGSADSGCSIEAPATGSSNALLGALGLCALAFAKRARTRARQRAR